MEGKCSKGYRAVHLQSIRSSGTRRLSPTGVSRRMPDDRMFWKGTTLKRFALFPTFNSVLSNAPELRLKSHHVVGFTMENRPPNTRRDLASVLPNLNEGCETPQAGTPRTPQARVPAVAEFKN
jgi:hypothetical protein